MYKPPCTRSPAAVHDVRAVRAVRAVHAVLSQSLRPAIHRRYIAGIAKVFLALGEDPTVDETGEQVPRPRDAISFFHCHDSGLAQLPVGNMLVPHSQRHYVCVVLFQTWWLVLGSQAKAQGGEASTRQRPGRSRRRRTVRARDEREAKNRSAPARIWRIQCTPPPLTR